MENGLPRSKADFLNSRSEASISLRKKNRYEALMNKRLKLTSSPSASSKSVDTILLELDIHNLDSVKSLRKELCNRDFDFVKLERYAPDIIQRISPGLEGAYSELSLEIAWCLTNLAVGSKSLVYKIAELIPKLASYILNLENKIMAEQACWVLGNLAAESEDIRDKIKQVCGLVKAITELLLLRTIPLSTVVCWTLCNLIRGHTPDASLFIEKGVVGIVLELTRRSCDQDECIESLWFLSFLTNNAGPEVYDQILHTENISSYLNILSTQHNARTVIPVIRILGNTLFYYEPASSLINNSMFINLLSQKLSSHDIAIQRETAWIFSNIFSGPIPQINSIIQSPYAQPIINELIQLIRSDIQEVKNEAGIALYNLCERDNSAYLTIVLNMGGVELLEFYINNVEMVPQWIKFKLQDITDCDLLKVSIGFVELVLCYDTKFPLALAEEIYMKGNSQETYEIIEKCQMMFEGFDFRLSPNEELVKRMCRDLIRQYFAESSEFEFS